METRIFANGKESNNAIRLEDIVLVYDHNAKRNEWKFRKAFKLFTSKDDNVRAATVKMHNQHSIHQSPS